MGRVGYGRAGVWLLAVAACGGGGDDQAGRAPVGGGAPGTAAATTAGTAPADTAAAVATPPPADPEALLRVYAEAGFRVYWPAGCERINEQMSNGPTRQAAREFIYTCDRDGAKGEGASIRCLRGAHDRDDLPAQPPLVVEIVEAQLRKFGARPVRQRPLESPGVQGVEVQAVQPDRPGEIWLRGLLAGTDVYVLMAWNKSGGLFEDPEVVNFFASFRIGAP